MRHLLKTKTSSTPWDGRGRFSSTEQLNEPEQDGRGGEQQARPIAAVAPSPLLRASDNREAQITTTEPMGGAASGFTQGLSVFWTPRTKVHRELQSQAESQPTAVAIGDSKAPVAWVNDQLSHGRKA